MQKKRRRSPLRRRFFFWKTKTRKRLARLEKNSFKALVSATLLGRGAMTVVLAVHDPARNSVAEKSAAAAKRAIVRDRSFALEAGRAGEIGPLRIVFRGLSKPHHLQMAVTLPELDPFYAYPYTIDAECAKEEFALAGQRFRLLSADRFRIRLKWMGPVRGRWATAAARLPWGLAIPIGFQ